MTRTEYVGIFNFADLSSEALHGEHSSGSHQRALCSWTWQRTFSLSKGLPASQTMLEMLKLAGTRFFHWLSLELSFPEANLSMSPFATQKLFQEMLVGKRSETGKRSQGNQSTVLYHPGYLWAQATRELFSGTVKNPLPIYPPRRVDTLRGFFTSLMHVIRWERDVESWLSRSSDPIEPSMLSGQNLNASSLHSPPPHVYLQQSSLWWGEIPRIPMATAFSAKSL